MGTLDPNLAEARYRVTFVPGVTLAAWHAVLPDVSGPVVAKKFAAAGFTSVRVLSGWTPLDTEWYHVECAIALDVSFPPVNRVAQRDRQWGKLWALLDELALTGGMVDVVPSAVDEAARLVAQLPSS